MKSIGNIWFATGQHSYSYYELLEIFSSSGVAFSVTYIDPVIKVSCVFDTSSTTNACPFLKGCISCLLYVVTSDRRH